MRSRRRLDHIVLATWLGAMSLAHVARAADEQAPVIHHTPVTKGIKGEPITISARIQDESQVFGPSLHYRYAGAKSYSTATMTRKGDVFVITIPGSADVEYWIRAFDELGNGPAFDGASERPHRIVLSEKPAGTKTTSAAHLPAVPPQLTMIPAPSEPAPLTGRAKAEKLLDEGDWERAAKELTALLPTTRDPGLLLRAGRLYEMLGDSGRAVQAYSRYISLVPNAADSSEVNARVELLTPLVVAGKHGPPPADDRSPPIIDHTPLAEWPAEESISVSTTITDQTSVYDPKIFYRLGDSGGFVALSMKAAGAGVYEGTVAPMPAGMLQYFIEAYDMLGNGPTRNGTPTYPHVMRVALGVARPRPLVRAPAKASPVQPVAAAAEETIASTPSGDLALTPPRQEPPAVMADLDLRAAPAPASPLANDGLLEQPAAPPDRTWAFVTLGVGAVAATLGVVLGLAAQSSAAEARSGTRAQVDEAMGSARKNATGATVSWIAAGAAVAGGGFLFVTSF